MADRSDLLAKIRKILALSKGSSEHEASAALAKARELMDQYGVDEADVALSEVAEAMTRVSGTIRPAQWLLTLISAIRRAMPVDALLDASGVVFIGVGAAPEIASYAFQVLLRQHRQARAEYSASRLKRCSLKRKRARADVFSEGWASAVFAAIARLYRPTPLDPLIRDYLARHHADLQSVSGRQANVRGAIAHDDRSAGRSAGRDVQLHQGVSAADAPLLLTDGGR